MDFSEFREVAKDPDAWRDKARSLRSAADSLWDSSITLLLGDISPQATQAQRRRALSLMAEQMNISFLLYGLAVEAALKGAIIANDPGSITFSEKKDDTGALIDVRIRRIGVDLAGDGHALVKLAETARVVGEGSSVFTIESDRQAIHEILMYLTDCVRWSSRYPAPLWATGHYKPTHGVPLVMLGHRMRDWLDPFLDAILPNGTKETSGP